jgi:hypothetical protein
MYQLGALSRRVLHRVHRNDGSYGEARSLHMHAAVTSIQSAT